MFRPKKGFSVKLCLLITLLISSTAGAAELRMCVFPVLPPERVREVYQPLADYLGKATGHTIRMVIAANFFAHWQLIQREEFDLVLDGPHFVGYRVNKKGHHLLAKFPSQVSYTLVANEDSLVLEADELIGKNIATTPSPNLGALRLAQIYANPMRQPSIVETGDSIEAINKVIDGAAVGAMVPAGMVGNYPVLATVLNTEQVPAPAITAAPGVDAATVETIREALLSADKDEAGQQVLQSINIARFEEADVDEYKEQESLLEGMWRN